MRGDAEAVEFNRAAHARERVGKAGIGAAGKIEPVGQQLQPRRNIGDRASDALRVGEYRVLAGAFHLFAGCAVETAERRARRQRPRRQDRLALRNPAPLGAAIVLDHAVKNGDNCQGRDHHGRNRNADLERLLPDFAHGEDDKHHEQRGKRPGDGSRQNQRRGQKFDQAVHPPVCARRVRPPSPVRPRRPI